MKSGLIQPYAAVHTSPQGPGDARPTALQIIEDENLTMKLSNTTVLITGGSSGIGVETARALHHAGADVFITTRDMAKAEKVRENILSTSPSSKSIGIIRMDLNSLASVKAAAESLLSQSSRLNILINNAGVMACPKGKTVDGFETHMGTNHFAHYLLTRLLTPLLKESSSTEQPSRVVNIASMGHWYQDGGLGAPGVFADLAFDRAEYNPMLAYGRSKLANILHAAGIEERYGSDAQQPIHAFSLHPGGITTELWRHLGREGVVPNETKDEHWKIWKNVEQGAATTVWCAVAKIWHGQLGRYCEDCGESGPSPYHSLGEWVPGVAGYAPWAFDPVARDKLWDISEKEVQQFI